MKSKNGIPKDANYRDINASTIDSWCRAGWEWGKPVSHEVYALAKRGIWDVYLTPTKPVPHEWFGELCGARVLGLASGGGQQIPVFAALGAECTVLDYSEVQCATEREVASREGYTVEIIRADMTERLPFEDGSFDLIFYPVSNCYIEEAEPVFRECYRVLRKGGRLLSGLDNGINFILDPTQTRIVNKLPFNPLKDEALYERSIRAGEGIQFSHTAEEQIGGQIRAGFMLTDLYEDTDREGFLHDYNIPQYLATLSIKP